MWNWAGRVECAVWPLNLVTCIHNFGASTASSFKNKKSVEYFGCVCFSERKKKNHFKDNHIKMLCKGALMWLHCFAFHPSVSEFRETEQTKTEICSPAVIQFGCLLMLTFSPYLPFTARQQWQTYKCVCPPPPVLFNVASPSIFALAKGFV